MKLLSYQYKKKNLTQKGLDTFNNIHMLDAKLQFYIYQGSTLYLPFLSL
jgi:hypothetical protein